MLFLVLFQTPRRTYRERELIFEYKREPGHYERSGDSCLSSATEFQAATTGVCRQIDSSLRVKLRHIPTTLRDSVVSRLSPHLGTKKSRKNSQSS
jgi:hypothetical protein